MDKITNLDDYRTVCQDCIYHIEKDGVGICTYPDDLEWEKNFIRCFTFAGDGKRQNFQNGNRV